MVVRADWAGSGRVSLMIAEVLSVNDAADPVLAKQWDNPANAVYELETGHRRAGAMFGAFSS